MRSSTSRHGSSDRRLVALVFGVLLGTPLLVLALLQTNYVLAYQACADRSNAWLNVPSVIALLGCAGAIAAGWIGRRRSHTRRPLDFLSTVAVLTAVMSLILIVALAIPPLILHPCD
jgi:uncharacterized membrane protein